MRQNSSVGVASRLQAGRSGILISAGTRYLFLLPNVQTGPPTLLIYGYWGSFSSVKRSDREVKHSPLSNADVKDAWSYTTTPPIFLHRVDRETFTIYIYIYITIYIS